jgi:hypothetical protein
MQEVFKSEAIGQAVYEPSVRVDGALPHRFKLALVVCDG